MTLTRRTFTLDQIPTADRYEAWGQFCRDSLVCDFARRVAPSDVPFSGQLTMRALDDVIHINLESDAFGGGVSRGSETADYIGVGVVHTPNFNERVRLTDGRVFSHTGSLAVWDASLVKDFAMQSAGQPTKQSIIMFPRKSLRDTTARLRTTMGFCQPDSSAAHVVLAIIATLNDTENLEPEAGFAIRNALIELVSGSVPHGIEFTHAAVSRAMRRKVENWVKVRLHSGDVSPESAARAHGLSVRSLHRLFLDSEETYGGFVRLARLERARQDLASSDVPVQHIAMRWGFSDASHFCREFRRTMGMTASDYRIQSRTELRAS